MYFKRPYKIYHYDSDDINQKIVISKVEHETDDYLMTAQGPQVKPGDHIEIKEPQKSTRYQVINVEYYSEPPDMWIAVLRQH